MKVITVVVKENDDIEFVKRYANKTIKTSVNSQSVFEVEDMRNYRLKERRSK